MPAARLSATSYLVLAGLAEHGPCTPDALEARVAERMARPRRASRDELDDESDRLVGLGLVRGESGLLDLTPSGRATTTSWLPSGNRDARTADETVARFAVLFAAAARAAGPA